MIKDLYDERWTRQQFTAADTPKLSAFVEYGLGLTQEAAQAGCLESPRLIPHLQPSASLSLWAAAFFLACKNMNRPEATADPDKRSSNEPFYRTPR